MMLAIPVTFRFRGQRNYVQGSDLLDICLTEVSARYPLTDDGFVRLTAHRIVDRQCTLYIAEPDSETLHVDGSSVEFSTQSACGLVRAALVPAGEAVTERFAYDEERIEAACMIEGKSITLNSDTGYTPIEVAIAMNKRLHNTIFPRMDERWIFTRIDLRRPFRAHDAQCMTITLLQNLGSKLSRAAITVAGETIGHIYFSAVPK
jgi:hypothetical protein